ncbi:unnamed protein product [Urochloa humidicola]
MTATGEPPCAFTKFVWRNKAPPRVQFFAWLLVQERIQCRANLLLKNIVDDAKCELCHNREETCDHIIFTCPFASQVWAGLGMDIQFATVKALWEVPRPTAIPIKHYDSFLLLVSWQIWKHRNDVVFNGASPSLHRLRMACKDDAQLWCYRWPSEDRQIAESWCELFCNM